MINKLVFATNNAHKLEEVNDILADHIQLMSLKEIGCEADIPETGTTLEENAGIKARYIYEHYHMNCFADDTGLEVEALCGAPGVYSARYAGEGHDSEANMQKLLRNLAGCTNRKAQFRTVISLWLDEKEYLFEGIVRGTIATEKHGNGGFGYDPIFIPDGYEQTFAQLGESVKNQISHRAIAVNKLCDFLKSIQ